MIVHNRVLGMDTCEEDRQGQSSVCYTSQPEFDARFRTGSGGDKVDVMQPRLDDSSPSSTPGSGTLESLPMWPKRRYVAEVRCVQNGAYWLHGSLRLRKAIKCVLRFEARVRRQAQESSCGEPSGHYVAEVDDSKARVRRHSVRRYVAEAR